jgi:hypothetical protein
MQEISLFMVSDHLTHPFLSQPTPLPSLDFSLFQTARRQLESVIPRLNKIAELQDELRECVSPTDIKTANQRLWLLRGHRDDLDRRLETRVAEISSAHLDRLCAFKERAQRFMDWADGLERRLVPNSKRDGGGGQMVKITLHIYSLRQDLKFHASLYLQRFMIYD